MYWVFHEGKYSTKFLNQYSFICSKVYKLYKYNINISHNKTTGLQNSLRRQFSRLNVLFICYGTAVEHRSLLNRSGICDGIKRYNIFLFMQPF